VGFDVGKLMTPRKICTIELTHFGVRIGLQAGSSCCVNLESVCKQKENVRNPLIPAKLMCFFRKISKANMNI
jgi:hypothetical protein